MSISMSLSQVLNASIGKHVPWTVHVPFVVDRKFQKLEDTHLATRDLNIRIGK